MPDNTMTLALDGNVPFREFAIAIQHFYGLIDALATELQAKEGVEWFIDDLVKSSAIATIRGESASQAKIETVVQGFAAVGAALQTGARIPYSPRVVTHARQIRAVINGSVTAVRFETAQSDIVVAGGPAPLMLPPAYSAIEGRIQTLTNRYSLRFTLFDFLHDRAVACYLQEGQEAIIREAWGRRAVVEGLVAREAETGRPASVRNISSIEVLPDTMPHYAEARGIVPVPDGAPSPEDLIRRLRDA